MFPEGRIFDFAIIGVLALIVVGPKDLPVLMRKVGRFVAHMRAMAAEFRASFDEMARQSELDELRREVEALRSGQNLQTAVGLGPESGMQEVFDDIHTGLREGDQPPAGAPELPAVSADPGAGKSGTTVEAAEEPPIEPSSDAPTHPARAAL
ncbi:MAG: twin-arginine translocase subunit TatB [Caulobacteraceae bacterium]|nr:twin-arginine translocase subunit TatB [Caulobacteraceae bacterium]